MVFDSKGQRLVSASEDGTVRVWDAASGEPVETLEGHEDAVRAIALSPDDRLAASGTRGGSVWIWDLAQGRKLAELGGSHRPITSLCFHPGGERVVSGAADGQVRLWDIASGEMRYSRSLGTHGAFGGMVVEVIALAFSQDGRRLFAGANNGAVKVLDADSGEPLFEVAGREWTVESVVALPGGRFLVALGDGTVLPLDAEGAWGERSLILDQPRLPAVQLGPGGRRLLVGDSDKSLRLWDVERGVELAVLRGHGSAARALAFAPDGARLASTALGWPRRRARQAMSRSGTRAPEVPRFPSLSSTRGSVPSSAARTAVSWWCWRSRARSSACSTRSARRCERPPPTGSP